MAMLNNDDLYLVDDYYGVDGYEDAFSQPGVHRVVDDDGFVDDFDLDKPKTDTSALEARSGKDIQGIPWERLNFSRDHYRDSRLRQYKNYESIPHSRAGLEKEFKRVDMGSKFYDFQFNTRLVKSTIVHFQLRNLLWATSKHDVYLMQNYSVMHWSSLLRRGKEVLNVAKPIVPPQKNTGALVQPLSRVQISTMKLMDNLMVAGGFNGELICKYLDRPGVEFCTKITNSVNAITNAVEAYHDSNGSVRVMTANNDARVTVFDTEKFSCLSRFNFDWSVNDISVSPDGRLIAVLGDNTDCLLADSQSGKIVATLKGHLDYSFSSAWHPDGRVLATGNQDTTCRLWDIRNLSHSTDLLKGRMGAIRGLKFSSDGHFLAMAEPADFVHIFNAKSGYTRAQEIDLFGRSRTHTDSESLTVRKSCHTTRAGPPLVCNITETQLETTVVSCVSFKPRDWIFTSVGPGAHSTWWRYLHSH
uniref:Transducin/WD40 repeat-like superfamily protein n=1 Tax=Kalanchoe fedtschenkoi TaxID=63787 RepID=A0A7N0UN76_KALFE